MITNIKAKLELPESLRALDKPSLHALAYVLRHPDTWPEGFTWEYNDCGQCAMGLAHQLWDEAVPAVRSSEHAVGASLMARSFSMPFGDALSIFYRTHYARANRHLGIIPMSVHSVTPEMVATEIESYLARAE